MSVHRTNCAFWLVSHTLAHYINKHRGSFVWVHANAIAKQQTVYGNHVSPCEFMAFFQLLNWFIALTLNECFFAILEPGRLDIPSFSFYRKHAWNFIHCAFDHRIVHLRGMHINRSLFRHSLFFTDDSLSSVVIDLCSF